MCFNKIILEINKDPRFDVHIFHYGKSVEKIEREGADEVTKELVSQVKNYHSFKENYKAIRSAIEKERPDFIIYPELGMSGISYYLAFSRLAPIQAMLPGHPDTSGVDSIDYYLTCEDYEDKDAQNFYSEQLVRFKNMPSYIAKPTIPTNLKTRENLGLPEDKRIYYCPMKNQKIHPDFDFAIKEILELDDKAVILFPKDTGLVSEIYLQRISDNIGSLSERIIYHPWASNSEFISYLKAADVILDTFHFGAGTTLFYAFAVDSPVVTLPAKTSVGRATYTFYKTIGVTDLIAKNKKEYVELAIKCANDKKFASQISRKINSKKEVLYNNLDVVDELKEFIISSLSKLS